MTALLLGFCSSAGLEAQSAQSQLCIEPLQMHQQVLELEARLAAAEALSRGFAAEARQANAMVCVPYPRGAWSPHRKGLFYPYRELLW